MNDEYLIRGRTLTDIGDAIRDKTGSAEQIGPLDMPDVIRGIQTGGTAYSPDDDVCFYDFDGTLLYSCTLEEAQTLPAMPTPPDHSGDPVPLEFRRWNWTLDEVHALDRKADIGAIFGAADGKTHFDLTLTDHYGLTVPINTYIKDTTVLNVDWGDGTAIDRSAGVSGSQAMEHTYAAAGTYHVTAWMDDGGTWVPGGVGSKGLCGKTDKNICVTGTFVLGDDVTFNWPSSVGSECFSGMSIRYLAYPYGGGLTGIGRFQGARMLQFLVFRTETVHLDASTFQDCLALRGLCLPPDVISAGDYAFGSCRQLRRLCLPKTMTFVGANYACRFPFYESGVRALQIPEGTEEIGMRCAWYNYTMEELAIPSSVTKINDAAFRHTAIRDFYFLPTEPPTMTDTTAFSDNAWGSQFAIHVPAGSLEAYQQATNWATWADKMVGDIT